MMLDKIKLALRITTNTFDDELTDLINACYTDLNLVGITAIEENDPLVIQAVKLYCKSNFSDLDDKQRFSKAYYNLKISMMLSGDYK